MPGSFSFTPSPPPLLAPCQILGVFRWDGSTNYQFLPNVQVIGVEPPGEGADPGSARFRYTFGDPLGPPGAPGRFEQVYPLDAAGPLVVVNDDRLVVRLYRDDGSWEVLFDGFALIPQADVHGEAEVVTFEAIGTPIRERDKPLGGAYTRDGDVPSTPNREIQTALPARFNPNGHPNASPDDQSNPGVYAFDSGQSPYQYPVFLGPIWPPNTIDPSTLDPVCELNGQYLREWSVAMAARYIVQRGNPKQTYTQVLTFKGWDDLMSAVTPTSTGAAIDITNSSTFTLEPIPVEDLDVTGMAWPLALEKLLAPVPFLGMRFVLETNASGDPVWWLRIYRKDDNAAIKSLFLQAAPGELDLSQTNIAGLRLARDAAEVVNQIDLDTEPSVWEVSLILAPLFAPQVGDFSSLDFYTEGNPEFDQADNSEKYRVFGWSECGEGYWSFLSNTFVTGVVTSLDGALQPGTKPSAKTPATGAAKGRKYVYRRRPALPHLVTTDNDGKPRKPELWVCADYVPNGGLQPSVWDPKINGSWEQVPDSQWELLPDRLGIRITSPSPNKVPLVNAGSGSTSKLGGALRLVDWIASGSTNTLPTSFGSGAGPITFRLTCALEADQDLGVNSPRRASSVTSFTVEAHHDVRDRFELKTVGRFSHLAATANLGKAEQVEADDTSDAQDYSDACRRATEAGEFAGEVRIPGVRTLYAPGDKVDTVVGRGVSLRSNLGGAAGESAVLPTVVSVRYEMDGEQWTYLQLGDRRAAPAPRRRRREYDR